MLSSDFFCFTIASPTADDKHARLRDSAVKHEWLPFHVEMVPELPYNDFLAEKHLMIRRTLEREKAMGKTHFLFLDAWDTVFVQSPTRFPPDWGRLCFGAENNCYPFTKEVEESYPKRNKLYSFPYLNSGVIWGPIDRYLELCPKQLEHDQQAWTKAYLEAPQKFFLDFQADVVLNLHSTKIEDLSRWPGGAVCYKPTDSWPFILHGNGKWPLPNFLEV